MATLMLCSCKATLPNSPTASNPSVANQQQVDARFRNADHQIMPVIYREQRDPRTPPPAFRQAQYAAGIQADCPCCNGACAAPKAAAFPAADQAGVHQQVVLLADWLALAMSTCATAATMD